jgi:hypothetical protein
MYYARGDLELRPRRFQLVGNQQMDCIHFSLGIDDYDNWRRYDGRNALKSRRFGTDDGIHVPFRKDSPKGAGCWSAFIFRSICFAARHMRHGGFTWNLGVPTNGPTHLRHNVVIAVLHDIAWPSLGRAWAKCPIVRVFWKAEAVD